MQDIDKPSHHILPSTSVLEISIGQHPLVAFKILKNANNTCNILVILTRDNKANTHESTT